MSLGPMLLAHRKRLRISAEALGDRLGVSRNWVQRLEGGVFELKVSKVAKVAEAYELDVLDVMRELAPDQLEAHRRTIDNDTALRIEPSPAFWSEVADMRKDIRVLTKLVAGLSEELTATKAAAASAARRAGRVERQLAPLTEQLAMTARDFERGREHDAAYAPGFLEEGTEPSDQERPRMQLRVDDLPEN